MSLNLDEEVMDGYLVSAETKKLWAVEMDLAKHLLDVCEKHNLRIWAAAGTLLGAVRHHGFIPWDDDMDFCMMREDYDKLIEIGPKEFKEPYFFQSFYTDEHYWGGMIKLRRSDTAMIEEGYHYHHNLHRGVFIDVFVLDAIPNNKKEFKKVYGKVKLLRRMLQNYRLFNPIQSSFATKFRHFIISIFFCIWRPESIQKKIEKLLSKNRIADNDYCAALDYSGLYGRSLSQIPFSDKHCYDETIMLPFHDIIIPAPKEFDQLLKDLYGDYMKPVMGGQAHSTLIVDCNRSYKEVLEELKNQ